MPSEILSRSKPTSLSRGKASLSRGQPVQVWTCPPKLWHWLRPVRVEASAETGPRLVTHDNANS